MDRFSQAFDPLASEAIHNVLGPNATEVHSAFIFDGTPDADNLKSNWYSLVQMVPVPVRVVIYERRHP